MSDSAHVYAHPSFAGTIGVARRDITPPTGIHIGNWGASREQVASGIHRPLCVTVLSLQAGHSEPPMLLAAVDLGWWKSRDDYLFVCGDLRRRIGIASERLLVCLSHTHAGPSTCLADEDKPGGSLVRPYLEGVSLAIVEAAREAIDSARPAVLSWSTGRCGLAQNRDFDDGERIVCGFNPHGHPDDALLVGRVTDSTGAIIATLVNYACHPTILAWENSLISPDFVGSMRETVERATGAPCLFLQGASGELAPAVQYTGDLDVPDRAGETLGFAALSVLRGTLPPGMRLRYEGVVESGAPLAVWAATPDEPSSRLTSVHFEVELPLKELPPLDVLERRWSHLTREAVTERLARAQKIRAGLGNGISYSAPGWIWEIGDTLLVAQPNEAYSQLQTELRRRFGGRAMVVINLANGFGPGYLPPTGAYLRDDLYTVWQTPFAPGALERLIEEVASSIGGLSTPSSNLEGEFRW